MNAVRWNQPFSRWVQRLMVVFGAVVLSNAVHLRALLPAVILGGLWILAGAFGFPLIDSIPAGSNDIAAGTRAIRRRRLAAMLMPLTAVLFIPAVLFVHEPYKLTAFVAGTIPSIAALMFFAWSACPRCRMHFFLKGARGSWTDHCVHCGQPLGPE